MIVAHAYDLVTDQVFLDLGGLLPGRDLFLKIEGLNPAGSIKLKTAKALVQDAERRGVLTTGGRVIESSSGNLGIALSMVTAAKGYSFTCITDPNASPHAVAIMRALGARVIVIDERDANGGYLANRIACIERSLEFDPGLVWLNQYANPANPRVHAERTAAAILREIGSVDYLFVGAGTTGTLAGCAAYFRRFSPQTRVIGVDAEGSVTFGHPQGVRHLPGLGMSRRPVAVAPQPDEIVLVAEQDAVRMCRRLAREHGLLVGGSTGSVLSAVVAKCPEISPGVRVVAISPDLGDRYVPTVYSDDWVIAHYGADILSCHSRDDAVAAATV